MNTNNTGPDFTPMASVVNEAQTFLCFVHPQATYDAVAAATSFCLAARDAGKSCTVVCEEPMRVEYNYLVGIDKVKQSVGNRDLVISFAYNENQVDKVSYNINEDEQRFELIVSPKPGSQPLDPATVDFEQTGLAADAILLFGYHSFDELGEIYEKERYNINHAYTVAFTQNQVPSFAKMHLELQPENFSYSEMVYFLIRQLQLAQVNDDLATNLLSGIEYATERFSQASMPARVFETVANLMRRGGQRQPDNPAFDQLNTPIRQLPTQANQFSSGQPRINSLQLSRSQSQVPEGNISSQNAAQQQNYAPQTTRSAQPISGQVEPSQQSSGQISSADLARAMSGSQAQQQLNLDRD